MKKPALLISIVVISCLYSYLDTGYYASSSFPETSIPPKTAKKATFAGGCFWCMEVPFEKLEGVYDAVSGYTGGSKENANYKDVCSGSTRHREVVQVFYDPKKISYQSLLDVFWRQIDPTDKKGSYVDRGYQYTSAIYAHDQEQLKMAKASKKKLTDSKKFDKPIVTVVEMLNTFYKAEDYHQDYYKKNSKSYKKYRSRSGRDQYIKKVWKNSLPEGLALKWVKPSKKELKKRLTTLQYEVTQEEATEKPFKNKYWKNTDDGLYVDIVSGEPLFLSLHKFKSGTGWPSFYKAVSENAIVKKIDNKLTRPRVEIRSKKADSHLGHLFKDGPQPTGLRYCINSASLRFIPKKDLEKEGYKHYLDAFNKASKKK